MAVGFPAKTTYLTGDVLAAADLNDITGTLNLLQKFASSLPVLTSPVETWTVSATAATGTVNFDCSTQGALYYTTNASANFTLNFRGNATTTLATALAVNVPITVSFLNTNGATAYYPTAFTIDGVSVTPKWSNGAAPSSGNVSAIDVYQFTIIKTAATPTYTVLAAGPVKYA